MHHCDDRITLTTYERQAMFAVPPASNDPLPKVTRRPVAIDADGTVSVMEFPTMDVVGIEYLPVVDKAA